jgi:hypothetical protein
VTGYFTAQVKAERRVSPLFPFTTDMKNYFDGGLREREWRFLIAGIKNVDHGDEMRLLLRE